MKKKIIILAALLMLIATGVSASSLNGEYKGNPIVVVKSDGKVLETDEVPAMVYDGHTVVPVSLLRQLGASVTWDQNTYSVTVKLSPSSNNDIPVNTAEIKKLIMIADLYQEIYKYGDRLSGLSNANEIVYNHYMIGTDAGVTIDLAFDAYNKFIDDYDSFYDRYLKIKDGFENKEYFTEADQIFANYVKSLDYYKTALPYLEKIAKKGYTKADFNSYYYNSSTGLSYADDNKFDARKNYDKYIGLALKNN